VKITKYPQSTVTIEKGGRKILIDPGNFTAAKYNVEDFRGVGAVLLTHEHADHIDTKLINQIVHEYKVDVYANKSVKNQFPDLVSFVVDHGAIIEVLGFKIAAYDMKHVALPDGSDGPQNTGYVIDDIILHPGDSIETAKIKVDIIIAPISGPDISLRDSRDQIVGVGAKIVVPIHYSIYSDDKPALATSLITRFTPDIDMRVLENGQSTEI
jgi:L-ascorbate metabolism protein UlaG (beta-lactamase superfamily)